MAQEIGVAEGDGIFIVALPMGLEGLEDQIGPLVKQGCIARIGKYISGPNKHILIDANVHSRQQREPGLPQTFRVRHTWDEKQHLPLPAGYP